MWRGGSKKTELFKPGERLVDMLAGDTDYGVFGETWIRIKPFLLGMLSSTVKQKKKVFQLAFKVLQM